METIIYEMTLLRAELRTTQAANKALAKRRQAKRIRLQEGDVLSVEDVRGLMAKKNSGRQQKGKEVEEGGLSQVGPATVRYCGRCAKPGYNIRICFMSKELSDEDSKIDTN